MALIIAISQTLNYSAPRKNLFRHNARSNRMATAQELIDEFKNDWKNSGWITRLILLISVFISTSSFASLSGIVFKWKGFILDGIEFYRENILVVIQHFGQLTGMTYSVGEADCVAIIFITVTSLVRAIMAQQKGLYAKGGLFISNFYRENTIGNLLNNYGFFRQLAKSEHITFYTDQMIRIRLLKFSLRAEYITKSWALIVLGTIVILALGLWNWEDTKMLWWCLLLTYAAGAYWLYRAYAWRKSCNKVFPFVENGKIVEGFLIDKLQTHLHVFGPLWTHEEFSAKLIKAGISSEHVTEGDLLEALCNEERKRQLKSALLPLKSYLMVPTLAVMLVLVMAAINIGLRRVE